VSGHNRWIVFSNSSKPGFDFTPGPLRTAEQATEDAVRLARIHPGHAFFTAKVHEAKVVTADLPPVETVSFT
jgi:hypothetical protein